MTLTTILSHRITQKLPISKVNELLEEQDSQLVLLYEEDSKTKARIAHTKASIALAMKEMEQLRPERAKVESSLTHYLRARTHQHAEVTTLCAWWVRSPVYMSAISMYTCRRRTLIDLYSRSVGLNEVVAASENELQLVYSSPIPYTLSIIINPATQRLASARVGIVNAKSNPLTDESYRFWVSPWTFLRSLKLPLMRMMLLA